MFIFGDNHTRDFQRSGSAGFSFIPLLLIGAGLTLLAVVSLFLVLHPPLSQASVGQATYDLAIDPTVMWFTACVSLLGAACVISLACITGRSTTADSVFTGTESSALLQSILEAQDSGVLVLDPSGRILEINNAGVELLGEEARRRALNSSYYDYIPNEQHQQLTTAIEHALEGNRTSFKLQLKDRTGATHQVDHTACVYTSPSTGHDLVLLMNRRILPNQYTDRIELAFNVTKQGIWDSETRSDEAYYNDNWYTMLGYEPSELPMTDDTWRQLLHPEDAEHAISSFEQQIQSASDDYVSEYRMRTKDGNWKWIRDVGRVIERDNQGNPTRAIGIHIDNDAAKRHELALGSLAAIDSSKYGTSALSEICRAISEAYDTEYVAISKVVNHGRVRVIAGWCDGKPIDNFEYDIAYTPCGQTMTDTFCHIESGVADAYPEDRELETLGISGYCGMRLTSRSGSHIGLLTLMSKDPIIYTRELESTVRIVGARAASEIERGVIEQSLHATQDRLRLAIRAARQGFWDWDLRTGEIYFSDEIYELLGYPAYEIDSALDWWRAIIHPDDYDGIRNRSSRENNSHTQTVMSEFRLRKANGEWHWFTDISEIVERDSKGNPARVICVISDNHEAKVNQNELAHTKQMLEETGRMANVGGWEYIISDDSLIWTDQTYRIHELDIGTPVDVALARSFYTEESKHRLTPLINACIEDGTPYDTELGLVTAEGNEIYIRTIGVAERVNGKVRRIYGTIQDVTEIRSALANLEIARDDAESASHAKSEFLANMSHEIRTPLTAILGNADLMQNDEHFIQNPDMLLDSIKSIQRNADHLLTIINDVLDSSKIDAGMMQIETISVNPSELIANATDMLFSKARTKGIELSVIYKNKLPRYVESDPTRIRQILLNLVGNAIKFTDTGSVRVEVSYNALPDKAGMIVLKIIDTGIGIPDRSLESLMKFEAFNQADGSMTRRFGGTGLGLRITNSLTRLLGGSLNIQSKVGKGTCVTATFRVQPMHEHGMWRPPEVNASNTDLSTAQAKPLFAENALAGTTILLVEDGEDNQRLITYMLERAGATVVPALNGKEAVDIYSDHNTRSDGNHFNIILMDMQMPELDGYSATMQLRQAGFTGPIIALTAHAMAGDRERCIEAGCQEYLTKPIKSARLVETCIRLLGFDCGFAEAA